MRLQHLFPVFVLCGMTASCSSSGDALHPVEGKVTLGGEPLARALVTFHPKESKDIKFTPPTGLTKDDGTFTITTGDKPGAPEGEYVVTIICSEPLKKKGKEFSTGPIESDDRLKGAYSNKERSQITVTIRSGTNKLEPFDLR